MLLAVRPRCFGPAANHATPSLLSERAGADPADRSVSVTFFFAVNTLILESLFLNALRTYRNF